MSGTAQKNKITAITHISIQTKMHNTAQSEIATAKTN
jgi:hypothetical protein